MLKCCLTTPLSWRSYFAPFKLLEPDFDNLKSRFSQTKCTVTDYFFKESTLRYLVTANLSCPSVQLMEVEEQTFALDVIAKNSLNC